MSGPLTVGAVLALLAWCALAGRGLLQLVSALPERTETRWVTSIAAGAVCGYALLAYDSYGVLWSRSGLLLGGALALLLLWRPLRRSFAASPDGERRVEGGVEGGVAGGVDGGVDGGAERPRLDGADVVALSVVAACALSSLALRSPFSDFVYHWGLKGHRFFLAHGIDLEFLSRPENVYLHPDYPNLVPTAFAATALLAGGFDPRALMFYTPLALFLLLAVARAVLRDSGLARRARQLVLAGLACALGAFCIGYFQGGSADVPFALALLLAAAALVGPCDRAHAAQLGVAAAFACGLKLEGLPFAALAIVLWLVKAAVERARALRSLTVWLLLALPSLALLGAWATQVLALDLLRESPTGGFDVSRFGVVLSTVWRQSLLEEWLGLPLLLALAPLLVFSSRARWIGLLVSAQIALYFWIYVGTPGDAAFYVLTTWPRLALHLLPAAVVGTALALAARPKDPAHRNPSPEPAS